MKLPIPLFLILLLVMIFSCKKENPDVNDPVSADTTLHEEPDDYIWDAQSVHTIELLETTASTDAQGVTINGNIVIINSTGNYRITGNLQGSILVTTDTSSLVRLILDNAVIENPSGPAILIESIKKAIINLAEGSQNSLTDGTTYIGQEPEVNSTLFSKSNLTIFGEGSLNVKGNFEDAVTSKDGLILKSGNVSINSVDEGIRGKDYLVIMGGELTIDAGGNGIVADNKASIYTGFVKIENGNITISALGDGIAANYSVTSTGGTINIESGEGSSVPPSVDKSTKGIKGLMKVTLAFNNCIINSSDDGIHSNGEVEIKSGNYSISTADDAIHANSAIVVENGTIIVSKSNEGFESKIITVNDGSLNITSSDDTFNATAGSATEQDDHSYVYFNGGYVVLNATKGDALDSNGSIQLNAGTVIVHGTDEDPEVAIDYNGVFNINGGFLVASGTGSNMVKAPSSSSIQHSLIITFQSSYPSSTLFHLSDAVGNTVITFKPERKFQSIIFSSAQLKDQNTYYLYTGGSSSGNFIDGVDSGGTYTAGNLRKEFTISSMVTTLNNI
ncbi:MAG TPA: carbohydrate-binding domain-containing protein [Lentimicrobium sp.]|nr:carbohydrate-binding domain-containing protein [Lentimicrobium sp.]